MFTGETFFSDLMNKTMDIYCGSVVKGYRFIVYDDHGIGHAKEFKERKEAAANIPVTHQEWVFQTLRSCTSTMHRLPCEYDDWLKDDVAILRSDSLGMQNMFCTE